jgi:hypothetical protein
MSDSCAGSNKKRYELRSRSQKKPNPKPPVSTPQKLDTRQQTMWFGPTVIKLTIDTLPTGSFFFFFPLSDSVDNHLILKFQKIY